eukprot:TRINITY_DN27953_c0_g1_i1.p1 TRINITY_DN27953_c0_g1~~TRINITY_DN27953_c0_g1_i1.p1  ORF type:complete len:165 (+),score=33.89 TRINITY_DN27953_c0_g1_i1:208-702(+)
MSARPIASLDGCENSASSPCLPKFVSAIKLVDAVFVAFGWLVIVGQLQSCYVVADIARFGSCKLEFESGLVDKVNDSTGDSNVLFGILIGKYEFLSEDGFVVKYKSSQRGKRDFGRSSVVGLLVDEVVSGLSCHLQAARMISLCIAHLAASGSWSSFASATYSS